MPPAVLFVLIPGAVFGLLALYSFEELIYRLYEHQRETWRSLGTPGLLLWQIEDKMPWQATTHARGRVCYSILFSAPDWIGQLPKGRLLVKLHRVSYPGTWGSTLLVPFIIS